MKHKTPVSFLDLIRNSVYWRVSTPIRFCDMISHCVFVINCLNIYTSLQQAELVIRVVNLVVHRHNYVFAGVEQFPVLQTLDQVHQRHMLANKHVHCNTFAIYGEKIKTRTERERKGKKSFTPGDFVSLFHYLLHDVYVLGDVVWELERAGHRQIVLLRDVLNTHKQRNRKTIYMFIMQIFSKY